MKSFLFNLFGRLLGRQLDFRVRLFNVLAAAGLTVGLTMTVIAALRGSLAQTAVDALSAALSFWLLYDSLRAGRYQLYYLITIAMIFFGLFTVLFFIAGGINGGVPYYFVFAVTFTVYMLEGKLAAVTAGIELIYYIALCLFGFAYPGLIRNYPSGQAELAYRVAGFSLVSVALSATMFAQFKLYNAQQRELEKARRELSEENTALDKLSRMKTEFLGNVSHEMKTPLTVISLYAQQSEKALEGRPEADEIARNMKMIASEADRLALFVSQMLDVTRIDEGRMSMNIEPVTLRHLVQGALQTYYPAFSKNNNTLMLSRGGDSPAVLCDPQRISQVVVNLVSNAVRHTRGGEILIGIRQDQAFAEVSVSDTGEGIPADRLPTIFERYKTCGDTEQARSARATGTGLGLYICRHIVEAHGGKIFLQSQPGRGTIARFTLPLQTAPSGTDTAYPA